MAALLPPNSMTVLPNLSYTMLLIDLPTAVDPVKDTRLTLLSATSFAPMVAPSP
jgi:hypothetical protein